MKKAKLFLSALLAFVAIMANAQNVKVTGTVTDAGTGDPVEGTTIIVKGSTSAYAVTDANGAFSLTAPQDGVLSVSCLGYKVVEIPVAGDANKNIALVPDNNYLDDVLVVAYGTASRASITGAVAAIDSDDIVRTISSSVTGALEGAAPGVQVNNTYGEPGNTPSIRIRGFGSINGSNSPLYVVDGVPYESSIANINNEDVESITVLKDAASAALYGNRAANGVVIITTKRAKSGSKPTVTFSTKQGMYTRGIKEYERLDADRWMEAQWEGLKNYAMSSTSLGYDAAAAAAYASNNLISDLVKRNIYDAADAALFDANGKLVANRLPGYTDLDWQDALEKKGYRSEYTVSFGSSSDKYNVYASLGYLHENGYIINTNFDRYTARVNSEFTPVKWFKGGVNVSAMHSIQNYNSSATGSYYANPFNAIRTMAPVYPLYEHDSAGNIVYDADGNPVYDTTSEYLGNRHVVYERLNEYQRNKNLNANVSAVATFMLPYGFAATVKVNEDITSRQNVNYNNPVIGDGAANHGRLRNYDYHYYTTNLQQQITWDHSYGKHDISVLAAHESFMYKYDYVGLMNTGMSVDGLFVVSNFPTNANTYGAEEKLTRESYLGRVRYNFDKKYYFDASFRRDGSSRFSAKNRWGNFYSVGAAWDIKAENFLRNVSQVDYLKLRVSYGEVGNDYTDSYYAYQALYDLAKNGGSGSLNKNSLSAEDLKWETTQTVDVAVEGRFFDVVDVNIGYFNKTSKDLIFEVPLPASAGSYLWGSTNMKSLQNIGSVRNSGVEISLGFDIINNRNWKWNISADATFLKNKVLTLPDHEDIANGSKRFSEGHSIYEWYVYHFEGVDQMTGNSLYTLDPEKADAAATAGKTVEINGTTYTTDTSHGLRDWAGTVLPTVYGSLSTSLSGKGLSLKVLMTYSLGGKVMDSGYSGLMSQSATSAGALHVDILKSWKGVPEGMTETSADRINPTGIPVNDFNLSTYNNAASDRWLTSASYLVMKNITLSYQFPHKWMRKIKFQDITINCGVENAFTLTSRQGLNPQYNFTGTQDMTYTTARIFNMGLTLKF